MSNRNELEILVQIMEKNLAKQKSAHKKVAENLGFACQVADVELGEAYSDLIKQFGQNDKTDQLYNHFEKIKSSLDKIKDLAAVSAAFHEEQVSMFNEAHSNKFAILDLIMFMNNLPNKAKTLLLFVFVDNGGIDILLEEPFKTFLDDDALRIIKRIEILR